LGAATKERINKRKREGLAGGRRTPSSGRGIRRHSKGGKTELAARTGRQMLSKKTVRYKGDQIRALSQSAGEEKHRPTGRFRKRSGKDQKDRLKPQRRRFRVSKKEIESKKTKKI